MKTKKMFLILMVISINLDFLRTESNPEIDNLHKMIPEVEGTDWMEWKTRFNSFNEKVWTMISGKAKQLSEKPRLKLNETDINLDKLLADDKTFLILSKRKQLDENIRLFYFYSLLIVSSIQFFASDSRPSIHPLPSMDGQDVIDWIRYVRPIIIQKHSEILTLHSTAEEWPLNMTSLAETQKLIDKVEQYQSYTSSTLVNLALGKKSVWDFVYYYGKYTPDLYDMLCIQKRYMITTQNITLHLSTGKRYVFTVDTKLDIENNFWFEFLILIYILFWVFDHIFVLSRLFL